MRRRPRYDKHSRNHRLLVFANEEGVSGELLDELWRIEAQGAVTYSHAFPPAPFGPGGRS